MQLNKVNIEQVQISSILWIYQVFVMYVLFLWCI